MSGSARWRPPRTRTRSICAASSPRRPTRPPSPGRGSSNGKRGQGRAWRMRIAGDFATSTSRLKGKREQGPGKSVRGGGSRGISRRGGVVSGGWVRKRIGWVGRTGSQFPLAPLLSTFLSASSPSPPPHLPCCVRPRRRRHRGSTRSLVMPAHGPRDIPPFALDGHRALRRRRRAPPASPFSRPLPTKPPL